MKTTNMIDGVSSILFSCMVGFLVACTAAQQPAVAQVGTKILTLSGVPSTCINVTKSDVDFWILSARVPKDNTFWTTTTGVGASVSAQLQGASGPAAFPAAASINAQDLNGNIVRASLSLHVLNSADLWDTSTAAAATKATSFSTPLTFVRDTGSSDYVKVFQALISFTSNAGSAVPAAQAMEPGSKLIGQFFNTLMGVFSPSPTDAKNPDFQLAFGLSKQDNGCQDIELHQGVGAMIADSQNNGPGIIQTQNLSNYCFYVHGDGHDPDIDYTTRNGACPSAEPPNGSTQLNNPQFIWLAYGTCKLDNCASGSTPQARVLANLSAIANIDSILTAKIGANRQASMNNAQQAVRTQNPNVVKNGSRAASVLRGLELCQSVGISPQRCADPHLGALN